MRKTAQGFHFDVDLAAERKKHCRVSRSALGRGLGVLMAGPELRPGTPPQLLLKPQKAGQRLGPALKTIIAGTAPTPKNPPLATVPPLQESSPPKKATVQAGQVPARVAVSLVLADLLLVALVCVLLRTTPLNMAFLGSWTVGFVTIAFGAWLSFLAVSDRRTSLTDR